MSPIVLLHPSLCVIFATTLIGCQSYQKQNVQMYDPVNIESNKLPLQIQTIQETDNYFQKHRDSVWFWSILPNNSIQPKENVLVQMISPDPIEAPPAHFGLEKPKSKGTKAINNIGPYQYWHLSTHSQDTCFYSQQYLKVNHKWLSLFTHYCTSDANIDFPSMMHFFYNPHSMTQEY